jgi:hypothetical protein
MVIGDSNSVVEWRSEDVVTLVSVADDSVDGEPGGGISGETSSISTKPSETVPPEVSTWSSDA